MLKDPSKSIIIRAVCSALVPVLQLFALYVLVHGHYSPGGGFQGGVIMAVSIILQRLYMGAAASRRGFRPRLAPVLASVGLLIFLAAGFLPLFSGGAFLDYGNLPLPGLHGAELRYYGILIVETGIFLAVFGTIVLLFDTLMGAHEDA